MTESQQTSRTVATKPRTIVLFLTAWSIGPLILGIMLISAVIGLANYLDSFVALVTILTIGFLGLMFLAASFATSRALANPSSLGFYQSSMPTSPATPWLTRWLLRWFERWLIRWWNRALSVSYMREASTALALYVAVEFLAGAYLVFIGISNLVFDVKGFDWGLVALTVFGLLLVTDSLLLYRRGFKQIAREV